MSQFDFPCGFSKKMHLLERERERERERVRSWLFVTLNIILHHIFPETFIEIPQAVQKI